MEDKMENLEKVEETFVYSYNAEYLEEIEQIRKKYLPPQEDKMELLRRLDRGVTKRGTMVSIILGTISTLIMGAGMSAVMAGPEILFIPGIIIGIIGLVGVGLAYPVFIRITKKEKERIAPMILELTEELSKGQ